MTAKMLKPKMKMVKMMVMSKKVKMMETRAMAAKMLKSKMRFLMMLILRNSSKLKAQKGAQEENAKDIEVDRT